jgi:N-acylglucosamine-6-phosphate 2-epimerase
VIEELEGKLVVSCQAPPGHPLANTRSIVALCRCAAQGGAAGLRVEGAKGVRAARAAVDLPVIGIKKIWNGKHELSGARPAITPEISDAFELAAAGASIVAIEATMELHQERASAYVKEVCRHVDALIMADVSTLAEGLEAYNAGADLIATTLSGYTSGSPYQHGPDLALVSELASRGIPTVAEGHITSPDQAVAALEAGARFVVVGRAITDPLERTTAFASALATALPRKAEP